MHSQIWVDPAEIDIALRRLGLTHMLLNDAVAAGFLARSSCTGNDAPFFPPIAQWAATLRALREGLLPIGWSKSDDGNYCTVIDPTEQHAIAVASGCSNTGNAEPGLSPTTKCPKGPSTLSAVCANAELIDDLFPETLPKREVDQYDQHVTWILLFFTNDKELRAELSLPASMGYDGHIDAWKERIILPSIPLDPITVAGIPDFGPDLEVDIKRRA